VGTPVSLIVVHSISLPPGEFGGPQVQALFTNTLDWDAHPTFRACAAWVSAHFFIRRSGELWQFVSTDERAWHAGASCHRGRANCNDHSWDRAGRPGGRHVRERAVRVPGAPVPGLAPPPPDRRHRRPRAHRARPQARSRPGFDWRALQRLCWPRAFYPDGVLG
jgi:AmpD protein